MLRDISQFTGRHQCWRQFLIELQTYNKWPLERSSQQTFTYPRLTIETEHWPSKHWPVQSLRRNNRKSDEICSKLTIKMSERRQWRLHGVFMVTLNMFHTFFFYFSLDFEQDNFWWVASLVHFKSQPNLPRIFGE